CVVVLVYRSRLFVFTCEHTEGHCALISLSPLSTILAGHAMCCSVLLLVYGICSRWSSCTPALLAWHANPLNTTQPLLSSPLLSCCLLAPVVPAVTLWALTVPACRVISRVW